MTHKANGYHALVVRRQNAALRLIERNERGEAGQIKALDARLGTGVGAKRERARLTPKSNTNRRKKGKAKS